MPVTRACHAYYRPPSSFRPRSSRCCCCHTRTRTTRCRRYCCCSRLLNTRSACCYEWPCPAACCRVNSRARARACDVQPGDALAAGRVRAHTQIGRPNDSAFRRRQASDGTAIVNLKLWRGRRRCAPVGARDTARRVGPDVERPLRGLLHRPHGRRRGGVVMPRTRMRASSRDAVAVGHRPQLQPAALATAACTLRMIEALRPSLSPVSAPVVGRRTPPRRHWF